MVCFIRERLCLTYKESLGHPGTVLLACHERLLFETTKTEVLCPSSCGTIKIPPCIKAIRV